MKKTVLIIYPYINQEKLVYHMVLNLRENGINADAINSTFFKFAAKPIIKPSLRLKIISFLFNLPLSKIRGVLSRVFSKELLNIAENYDLIDFHVLSRTYDNLILKLIDNKIIKVTIWGSDFYRACKERREEQRIILNQCDCIQIVTNTMKNDFIKYFKDFQDKIKVANFGVFQYDTISKLQASTYSKLYKIEKYEGKLMVVCGYNGIEAQQHSNIIDAINSLDNYIKDSFFLVFPMTYGSTNKYIRKIESELKNTGLPHLILKSYMSDTEMAQLRIEADLVINIQTTDAFAGSLQEHLYAGNLLLVGDWLPYNILDENNVFYKKTNLDDLANQISDCIVNYSSYKKMTLGNTERMHNISSWSVAGKEMSVIYKELLK